MRAFTDARASAIVWWAKFGRGEQRRSAKVRGQSPASVRHKL